VLNAALTNRAALGSVSTTGSRSESAFVDPDVKYQGKRTGGLRLREVASREAQRDLPDNIGKDVPF
jgi:hypothetical protein